MAIRKGQKKTAAGEQPLSSTAAPTDRLAKIPQEGRTKYADLFDFAPFGYFVLDAEGIIVEANLTGASLLGIKRNDLLKHPFSPYVHPENRKQFSLDHQEVITAGVCKRSQVKLLHPKQGVFFAEFLMDPAHKTEGLTPQCRLAVMDITHHKKAEEDLKNTAKFPDENPFPVLRLSAEGIVLYSNGPGQALLEEWHCGVGQKIPEAWRHLVHTALRSNRYQVEEVTCGSKIFSIAIAPIPEGGYVNLYGRDITKQRQTELALQESEQRVRKKLENILSPEEDIGQLELADIIDFPALQSLMDNFYELTRIPMTIIDMTGKMLVGVGWQDICTKFHRVHPQTCAYCLESDLELTAETEDGAFKLYKCKNNLWDAATPVIIGDKKMGYLFTGQFFFEDETPDYDLFRRQAKHYGFDETEYMAALDKVPRLSSEMVRRSMEFLRGLSQMISQSSYSAIKLARLLTQRDELMGSLRQSEERFRTMADAMPQLAWMAQGDGYIYWYNQRWYNYTGTTAEQMEGWGWQSVHDPVMLPAVMEHWKGSIATGEPFEMEFPLRGADGQFRRFLTRGIPLKDAEGRVVQWFGTNTDVDALKQAEEAIGKAAIRFEILSETASKLLSSENPQYIINALCREVMDYLDCHIFINYLVDDNVHRLHLNATGGLPDEMAQAIEWLDFGQAICGRVAQTGIRIVAEDIQESCDVRADLVRSCGICAYACHPIMAKGEVIGTLSFGTRSHKRFSGDDLATMKAITDQVATALERKRDEELLLESREDLNRAQFVGHIGSWRLNVHTNELTWSEESHRIFGLPKDTPMTYETFLAAVHPDDLEYVDSQWQAALAGKNYDLEHRIVVDGNVKWLHERAYLEFDANKVLIGGFGISQDITERKQMEEELRKSHDELEARVKQRTLELAQTVDSLENEVWQRIAAEDTVRKSEERYRSLTVATTQIVWITDIEGNVVADIPLWREFTGQTLEEIQGWGWINALHPDDRQQTAKIWRQSIHNKTLYETEYRIRRHDGEYRYFSVRGVPVLEQDGSIREWVGTCTDITEHKQAHERIHFTNILLEQFTTKATRKEYLDAVVYHIQEWSDCQCVGVRLLDEDGWISYESSVGFSPEFLAAESQLSLGNDNCLCIRAITQSPQPQDSPLTTSRGSFCCGDTFKFINTLSSEEKTRYRGTCLRHGFASLTVIPIRYRDQVVGAIHLADCRQNKILLEMTEFLEHTAMLIGEAVHRFDIEIKLRESEEQYRLLVELSPDGIGVESNGRILFANTMAAKLLGYSGPDELIGRTILDFVHPDFRKRIHKQLDYLRKKQIPLPLREEKLLRADGTIMDVEIAASPLDYHHSFSAQIVFRDITERKRAEAAIRQHQQALRTMAAQLQLAEEQERRRIAQDIHDSIGQILAFSAMEINSIRKVSPEPLHQPLETIAKHLGEAIKQARTLSFDLSPSALYDLGFEVAVEDLVERFSKERKIKCRFENCKLAKPLNEDVKVLLYRSIRELLMNAAKYAKAKKIKVSVHRSGLDISVTVEDDGCGFDVSILENTSQNMAGFGLFSIRERLNHIGGRLKMESAAGKGTRAVLIAPLDINENGNRKQEFIDEHQNRIGG